MCVYNLVYFYFIYFLTIAWCFKIYIYIYQNQAITTVDERTNREMLTKGHLLRADALRNSDDFPILKVLWIG